MLSNLNPYGSGLEQPGHRDEVEESCGVTPDHSGWVALWASALKNAAERVEFLPCSRPRRPIRPPLAPVENDENNSMLLSPRDEASV